jgi:hypothetical protein
MKKLRSTAPFYRQIAQLFVWLELPEDVLIASPLSHNFTPSPLKRWKLRETQQDMAVGKNKRLSKGKKGLKKKVVDPFTRKEWYDVKAPSFFEVRNVGKTLVNKTQGLKIAKDALKNRVLEVCLADLNKNQEDSFRKIKLQIQEISGRNCLTNFYGMDMTSDKLRSLVKKWQVSVSPLLSVAIDSQYNHTLWVRRLVTH